jgi:hypothetical protein
VIAVYDFAVSRISFDFFGFLVVAEMERQRRGADNVHLVVVPAEGDGFHPNVQYDLQQKQWRLQNIVVAGTALLPTVTQFTVCSDRDQARAALSGREEDIHPEGYAIDAPIGRWATGYYFLEAHLGGDPRVLRSSEQARMYVGDWLRQITPAKSPVSLTLREATHNAQRNTDREVWLSFADWLAGQGYCPVIVPDTETVPEWTTETYRSHNGFSEAAFNLDLRLALYERCFLNVNVTNGPSQLCGLSPLTRNITFVTGDWLHEEPTPFLGSGLERGEAPPYSSVWQKFAWRVPTLDALKEEFLSIVEELGGEPYSTGAPNPFAPISANTNHDPNEIAMRFLTAREWELFDHAADLILEARGPSADIYYLQALAARARSLDTASEFFKMALATLVKSPDLVDENSRACQIFQHIKSLAPELIDANEIYQI